jgi:hypothetical protein
LGLTGCTKALPLTEEEEGMVAELMAKELLESQEGYTQALIEPTEVPEPTKAVAIPVTATATPTATPIPLPIVEPTKIITDDLSNQKANADFAQVMGMSNIDVEYIGYERLKSLTDGSYNFQATDGKELLVVKFNVKNTSKKELQFNLTDLDISYQLDINTEDKIKPIVTLKDNDLRFIDLKINANGARETVLIFAIDESLKIDKANLIISRDNKTAIIKLK